jgi:sporulation protein YlmC with PRC-barrel domain
VSKPEKPQVSWMAIEANAPVFSSEGEAVGTVESVVGDPDADVFTGLAVSIDILGPARLVPSEHVRGIWPDRVDLALTKVQIERLPEYEETPTVRWRPSEGVGGFLRRLFGGR